MTRRHLVTLFGVLVVLVLSSNSEECPEGNSNGKCAARASHNNEIERLSTTQETMTHTPESPEMPKSLNMLVEDSDNVFRPTPVPSPAAKTTKTTNMPEANSVLPLEEPKGRALNFTAADPQIHSANILTNSSEHHTDFDLSDVSINDEDDFDMDMVHTKILAPKSISKNLTMGICEKGGLTYENGEKLENGCESVCTCNHGKMDCTERCSQPFFRTGKKIEDPLCSAHATEDPCCSILACASDTETEPLEICSYNNQTYNRGDIFNNGCTEVCTCEIAGNISCKPRCLPTKKTSDRCVEVPDPNDQCCKKVLCDVTLDDNDSEKDDVTQKIKITQAKFINATTILLKFDSKPEVSDSSLVVDISDDKTNWQKFKVLPGGYVLAKKDARYLKLENSDDIVHIQNFEGNPKLAEKVKDVNGCNYKGKLYNIGDEYNDACEALCVCQAGGMKCLKLQCPTYFGVDVLDPNCVEWETIPADFVPAKPNCCPESIKCKNNGSCDYQGKMYKNWEQLPLNVSGCEKRCYCEMGKVECQNTCPPVTAYPPADLQCPPNQARIGHIPEDDCCKYWVCNPPDTATVPNETITDKGHSESTTKLPYLGPFATKSPSKVLGPLSVYENGEKIKNPNVDTLGTATKPKVSPNENPFYHKQAPSSKKDDKVFSKDKNKQPFQGPFNPSYKDKSKNSKDSLFVTPPSEKVTPDQEVNSDPSKSQLPFLKPHKNAEHSEIEVHGHSNPEELLQFISQHPELSNYPSGSVFEVHNNNNNLATNQNAVPSEQGKPQIHLVPYLVPQNSAGEHVNSDLPPGFTLEQILGEFHKNSQPSVQNILPHHPQFNRPPFIGQPSGPLLPNRPNTTTYPGFDGGLFQGHFAPPQDDITVHTLEAIDPHTVRLAFMVPPVIVNLHGRVEVRYTNNKDDNDLDSWMLQVFAPPNDLIATRSLEFDLQDLKASTEYKIKITITLRDIHTTHSSRIYKIKTPREIPTATLPPIIPIEPDLAITDINATWVTVTWKKFDENELQFIDGVQLRFREIDGKIYAATPLIHRAVTSYTLENLKPNTKYELGIFFIPFPGQLTELHAEKMLHFTTANAIDTYGFNVSLEISQVKSQSVEISWNGVPYPEDKYVNIYRAIYQSDSGKEDQSMFKIAKRDSTTKTVIMDLKPGTRYRLWLEVYLTNGKIKTSNVQEFITKPRVSPALGSTSQDKLSRAQHLETKGDYYGPLVIVAILAAIAILSTLVLLLILIRRHNQNKAAITPPTRISQSAYDNPTYKVEIQQETMGL
ncbi:unnamed protein product [Phaedon cochleariae]|uniref:Epidermal cell surface receptor n=1 Tax=Phaedon cochleariae TaxID=80249 RepID=A0A9P0D8T1_PHACE|nr:unnamed protein product [Phaedon cochleariae]